MPLVNIALYCSKAEIGVPVVVGGTNRFSCQTHKREGQALPPLAGNGIKDGSPVERPEPKNSRGGLAELLQEPAEQGPLAHPPHRPRVASSEEASVASANTGHICGRTRSRSRALFWHTGV